MMTTAVLRIVSLMVCVCVLLAFAALLVGAGLPQSQMLAFAVRHPEENYAADVFIVDMARGLTTRYVEGMFDIRISFAPNGEGIFSRELGDGYYGIFRVSEAGDEILISPDDARDNYPVWSPDGTQVAFLSLDEGARLPSLYVMSSDGSGRRNLSRNISPNSNTYPVWLPDNTRVMYGYVGAEQNAFFFANSITGELFNFTYNTGIGVQPFWSPDGRHIAYVLYSAQYSTLYVAEVGDDGRVISDSTHELSNSATSPRWSPDGTRLAYVTSIGNSSEIYLIAPDGSAAINLSQNAAAQDNSPTWSNDGTQIAFMSNRDGSPQMYVMNADGSNVRRVTNHQLEDGVLTSPMWLP